MKVNILHYYRRFAEKSRALCEDLRNYCRRFAEKTRAYLTGRREDLRNDYRRFAERSRAYLTGRQANFLHYYRTFAEKTRAYLTGRRANSRNDYRRFAEKSRAYLSGRRADFRNYCRKLTEKSRALCVAYLSGRRVDIFLLAALVMVLASVTVHRSCRTTDTSEHVSITISSQCGSLFGRDIVAALIREFEEQNPHLKIQEVTQEASATAAAIADGITGIGASGTADIVFFDDSEFSNLTGASALAFLAGYNRSGRRDGQSQWALPLVSFIDIFVYNIDILKAANYDRPPKTHAEFLAAARAVAGSGRSLSWQTPVSAFAVGLSESDPMALRRDFYPWIWANGGDIHSIDISGEKPVFPRTVTDTIAFFGQLHRENLLAPGTFEKDGVQRLREFAEGRIAMMMASARDIAFLQKNANGITFGITTIPAITQGKNRLGLSTIYAGINSACPRPGEAWTFLAFLAGKSNVLSEALGAVPGSFPGAFAGEYIEQNPLYSKAWDIFESADIVEYRPDWLFEEKINLLLMEKLVEAFN